MQERIEGAAQVQRPKASAECSRGPPAPEGELLAAGGLQPPFLSEAALWEEPGGGMDWKEIVWGAMSAAETRSGRCRAKAGEGQPGEMFV